MRALLRVKAGLRELRTQRQLVGTFRIGCKGHTKHDRDPVIWKNSALASPEF